MFYFCSYIFQTKKKSEKEDFGKRLQQNYVVGSVINSKGKINVPRFEKYLKDSYEFRVTKWDWCYVGNAMHETYGHIIDSIKRNGGRGLGQRSEVKSLNFYSVTNSMLRFTFPSYLT